MVGLRHSAALRYGADEHGRPLSTKEREKLLAPYLPKEDIQPSRNPSKARPGKRKKQTTRDFVRTAIYSLIFTLIHLAFSIYIRIRRAYRNVAQRLLAIVRYHHRTPELIKRDVRDLSRLPDHLSIILNFDKDNQDGAALESLVHDVCECAAWTACAGIPTLSIYERTGVLKASMPQLHRHISSTMSSYFGAENPSKPTISLRAPLVPAFSPPTNSPDPALSPRPHLTILILSATDGRSTLVDLTKTLAEMSQKQKLSPDDISTELIDAEISESVMEEPDLLILFGESVVLQGYPPWQVRLSEIFHVPDNHGVGYQVFLQGLHKYAGAQMRFGS